MVDERDGKEEIVEQQEFERSLSMLRPAGSRIDRDCLLFLAGRASAEPIRPGTVVGRWMWPAATLASSLVALVLLALLVTRSGPGATHDAQEVRNNRSPVPAAAGPRAVAVVEQPDSPIDPRAVPVATPDEAAREIAAASNYPRLRSFVLAYGIDALPEPTHLTASSGVSTSEGEPRTERELLQQLSKGRG